MSDGRPRISVVMSVFNGAASLRETLDSILGQSEADFELLVVDDGSTDATASILHEYALCDGRIRVMRQGNSGLTRALIAACAAARGEVIARHDAGDRSHPERLARQLALLRDRVVLSSCSVRYVGPEREYLYTAAADGPEVRRSLLHDDSKHIHGIPHHGSAMFVRAAYLASGGYREAFGVAQDLDLWIRMARIGEFAIAQEELYEASIGTGAISSRSRREQLRLTQIAVSLRDGGDAQTLLREARSQKRHPPSRRTEAAALYFIAQCLRRQRNPAWRRYVVRAIARNPLHLRAWLSLVQR